LGICYVIEQATALGVRFFEFYPFKSIFATFGWPLAVKFLSSIKSYLGNLSSHLWFKFNFTSLESWKSGQYLYTQGSQWNFAISWHKNWFWKLLNIITFFGSPQIVLYLFVVKTTLLCDVSRGRLYSNVSSFPNCWPRIQIQKNICQILVFRYLLKGQCHEIFTPRFFSWINYTWTPYEQAKTVSRNILISRTY